MTGPIFLKLSPVKLPAMVGSSPQRSKQPSPEKLSLPLMGFVLKKRTYTTEGGSPMKMSHLAEEDLAAPGKSFPSFHLRSAD